MIDSDVSLDGHGADYAQSSEGEEEQDESEVLAQGVSIRPCALHISGDGHWTGEDGSQEIRDRQTADQRVEGGLLLLPSGLAEHHDGDQVADDSEDEHDGRDGGLHPARRGAVVHVKLLQVSFCRSYSQS